MSNLQYNTVQILVKLLTGVPYLIIRPITFMINFAFLIHYHCKYFLMSLHWGLNIFFIIYKGKGWQWSPKCNNLYSISVSLGMRTQQPYPLFVQSCPVTKDRF